MSWYSPHSYILFDTLKAMAKGSIFAKIDCMSESSRIAQAVDFVRSVWPDKPMIGVILGSGLGGFAKGVDIEAEIPYCDIPHFPVSTVKGHGGKLIIGTIEGKRVIIMSGRFHYYEGYTSTEVVFPIRVLHQLGVTTLLISNAAGGVNADFTVGDLMVITDHISFSVVNPLIGPNNDEIGPRFPDMSEPYSKELIAKAHGIAIDAGINLKEGVYFAVTGPSFETRAEYKFIQRVGADAVGMSTAQEVITAVHCGMTVFAISVITDLGIREEDNKFTHEEVLDAANAAAPLLTTIFKKLIATL
jgi:purine-nucleoside phosphorylase